MLSCLCLLDPIIELHIMNEKKCSMTFSWKVKVDLIYKHFLFDLILIFCICGGVIFCIKLKSLISIHESIF